MRQSIRTVWKAFSLLDLRDRRAWAALVPLAVIAAFLESVGALLIFGLIGLTTDATAAQDLPAIARLRALAPDMDNAAFITIYGISVALFFVLKNGFRFLETYARQRIANNTSLLLSRRLLSQYLLATYAFHLRHNSADLIRNTHATSDLVARTVLVSGTAVLSEALIILGMAGALAVAAPSGTLVAVVGALLVTIPLLRAMQSNYARWGETTHGLNGIIQRRLQEAFRGIKEIKVLSGERFFIQSFVDPRSRLARITRWTDTLKVVPRLAVETFFVIAIVAVIVMAMQIDMSGGELIALLGLIAYALMRLLPSLHLAVYHLNNCRFGEAAVNQLAGDWGALDHQDVQALPHEGQKESCPFNTAITFEKVGFSYPCAAEASLHDIDLAIGKGDFIGIVGSTGAGKSTLVDLLLGLHDPTQGRIRVDGNDLAPRVSSWQSRIGYVSQHAFFIDDSLRRNIALGLSDSDSDEARINRALEQAQLREFVNGLPQGLDTLIGEAGVRLSGGERQRLAIARAIYRDPDILVFDEATSALDSRTERAVSNAIENLRRDKTIIVIAHRLSTVRHCDRLILLRAGRIADSGTFDELAARNEDFRQIAGLVDDTEVSR